MHAAIQMIKSPCLFGLWEATGTHSASALFQGNINLIKQAAKSGVKKFILVTSIGSGDSKDAPPEQVYNVLKPVLVEKTKAEDLLKASS